MWQSIRFRREEDKEVSHPKTKAMRVKKWIGKTT
eukprot:SAG31_NODE_13987_length_833_cov_1.091281_1_plen_33_part_10